MKMRTIAICAIMTALALALSYAENVFALTAFIPIPGIKLGLANIVTLTALYTVGVAPALIIAVLRSALAAAFTSGATSFIFSVTGGLLSVGVMYGIKAFGRERVSLWGVSIAGAAAHNTGQIIAAWVMLGSASVFAYLPLLLVASILTGAAIAAAAIPVKKMADSMYI